MRRYTDLPALLYMLRRRTITLLNPQSWDDRNDSYFLEVYKRRNNLLSVLALCFSEERDSYHNWRVFSPGSSGVCVHFNKEALLTCLSQFPGVRFGAVKYKYRRHLGHPSLADLPFLKRRAFSHEREFRILYESVTEAYQTKDFSIPLDCISQIAISPWAPESLGAVVKETIRAIEGCAEIRVGRSDLLDTEEWKQLGDGAV